MHAVRRTHLRALLLALALAAPAAAEEYTEREAELEALREQIQEIQRELERDRAREDDLRGELRRLDQGIGRTAVRLDELADEAGRLKKRIGELESLAANQERELGRHRDYLARQLVSTYITGRQEYLKLLLNQQNPSQLQRVLVYYDYFNRARSDRMQTAMAELRELADTRSRLDRELAALQVLEEEQQAERQRLQESRGERERLLAQLEESISAKGARLENLRADEAELERLLRKLEQALADIPERSLDRVPFPGRKGHLPWPLEGRLAARYGDSRGVGEIRWRGLLIDGDSGDSVKAVSHGRVVFSDWLRGFGLLLIVDHGDGYMSLYGHNESLYKDAGDWVEQGEIVATVGASGGRPEPGLYFEIRAAGKPQDPQAWLRPKGGGRG